ncbi:MAG: phosphoribosylformylglycinamidine synthase subunit PurQ [Nitrospirae bacterium]|nr:phosphoribosylformylglycinamidine synthase subunit PurQ [Nitrospirota bacterium]
MRFGIIVFPGSNCDHDCYHVLKNLLGQPADFIWHKETHLHRFDALIIPGGFSYGDYLRTGAIAKYSPVMKNVGDFARAGGPVLGICNGFQILLEAGLLPGAMLRNRSLKFICKNVFVRVETAETSFTAAIEPGRVLKLPIAHAQGNYYADPETLNELKDNNQVIFRYCDKSGNINDIENPNGSKDSIAGICNRSRNVLGMMPHPERCAEGLDGNSDGRLLFQSALDRLGLQSR